MKPRCVSVWRLRLPCVTQHPPQALRFSHGFAKRRARNASDWWYFYWDTQRKPLRRRESGGSFTPSEGSPRPRANFFSSYLIYGGIRCIALCLLPRATMGLWLLVFTYFGISVPSIFLGDLLGNTCLLARVQKVTVCDSWLMDFDPLCLFRVPRFVAL